MTVCICGIVFVTTDYLTVSFHLLVGSTKQYYVKWYTSVTGGQGCTAYEVVINTEFFAKLSSREVLLGFFLTVVLEGFENKYNITLNRGGVLQKIFSLYRVNFCQNMRCTDHIMRFLLKQYYDLFKIGKS